MLGGNPSSGRPAAARRRIDPVEEPLRPTRPNGLTRCRTLRTRWPTSARKSSTRAAWPGVRNDTKIATHRQPAAWSVRPSRATPVSRFYLSLEDDLLRLVFEAGGRRTGDDLDAVAGQPIEMSCRAPSRCNSWRAQNFETHKNVLKYDDVMNRQPCVIYASRRKVLEARTSRRCRSTVDRVVESAVRDARRPSPTSGTWTPCGMTCASSTR